MQQRNNVVMLGASGALGGQLVFKQYGGKTVICMPAQREYTPTAKQQEARNRFADACRYGRMALANPVLKAMYQARATPAVRAYNLAVADFFTPPVITAINTGTYTGRPGDMITVYATDDYQVQQVYVTITAADGNIIEAGAAAAQEGNRWMYTAKAVNAAPAGSVVQVQVSDMPGNVAEAAVTL